VLRSHCCYGHDAFAALAWWQALVVVLAMLQLAAAARPPPPSVLAVLAPILDPLLPGEGVFGPESYPSPPPSHAPSPPPFKPPPPSPPMSPATSGTWSAVIKLPLVPAAATVVSDNVVRCPDCSLALDVSALHCTP